MDDLDDVLNGVDTEQVTEGAEEAEQVAEAPEVTSEVEEPTGVSEPAEAEVEAEAETDPLPPSGKNDKKVPLSALKKVLHEKTDWKEKAIRAQAELDAFNKFQQPQYEPQEIDPEQRIQQQILNERFNTSEMMARQTHADMDDKLEVWMAAVQQNPALQQVLHQQQHPWEFMYKEAAKMQLQQQIGDNPDAYKASLEEEIRAKILAEQGTSGTPAVTSAPITKSLASTRSSAPRGAPTFSGPTSLDQILN